MTTVLVVILGTLVNGLLLLAVFVSPLLAVTLCAGLALGAVAVSVVALRSTERDLVQCHRELQAIPLEERRQRAEQQAETGATDRERPAAWGGRTSPSPTTMPRPRRRPRPAFWQWPTTPFDLWLANVTARISERAVVKRGPGVRATGRAGAERNRLLRRRDRCREPDPKRWERAAGGPGVRAGVRWDARARRGNP
jgi:hypothetical protein